MIENQTIKCPTCQKDTCIPSNQPLLIDINEDILCPHCHQIVIKCTKPVYKG